MKYSKYILLFIVSVACSTAAAQNRDSLDDKAEDYIRNNDFQHAVPILQKAAALGSTKSQYNYAVCLSRGAGVDQNDSLANVFLEKAAVQGNVDAQFKLASSYRIGRGITPNVERAMYWYEHAAELGDVESQEDLAVYYRGGNGIPRDTVKMLYWLTRAATQRNPKDDTINNFGSINQSGDTIIKGTTSVGYQNSTEISGIRYTLATMYLTGESVPKDSLKAYAWLLITNENKKDFPVANITGGPYQTELINQVKFLESRLSDVQQRKAEHDAAKLLGRPLKNLARKTELDLD